MLILIIGVKGRIRSCGFLRIFIYTDGVFLKVRLGYSRVKECPAGFEISAGA